MDEDRNKRSIKLDLRECPFCGNIPEAYTVDRYIGNTGWVRTVFVVECIACATRMESYDNEYSVELKWNTRSKECNK